MLQGKYILFEPAGAALAVGFLGNDPLVDPGQIQIILAVVLRNQQCSVLIVQEVQQSRAVIRGGG